MAEKKVKELKSKTKETPKSKKASSAKEVKKTKDVLISEVKGTTSTESEAKNGADNSPVANEVVDFSGQYIKAIGRRKRSVARVRLYEGGKGIMMINHQKANEYFPGEGLNLISQPLKVTGHARDFNFSILVSGGGKQGQVGAVRLGISRVLLVHDPESKEALKVNGFLTRDPRQVERKKPGLRKARKAPQWSKR